MRRRIKIFTESTGSVLVARSSEFSRRYLPIKERALSSLLEKSVKNEEFELACAVRDELRKVQNDGKE